MPAAEMLGSSLTVWSLGIGLLLAATVAGFIGGLVCSPHLQDWVLRRASRRVDRLAAAVLSQLDRADVLCGRLAQHPALSWSADHEQRFQRAHERLTSAWHTLQRRSPGTLAPPRTVDEITVDDGAAFDWIVSSRDPATQLADRNEFHRQLERLLKFGDAAKQPSGLLVVKLDKADQLTQRFGQVAVDGLERRLASIVTNAVRPIDLVCRLAADEFAVLMPGVSPLAGARVAETVRAAVRQHPFRLDDRGPELLVTASFGYSACLPGEAAMMVQDRCQEAVRRSQSAGRNQLHLLDATHRTPVRMP